MKRPEICHFRISALARKIFVSSASRPLAVSSRMAGVMWDSNGLVRCIRAVLPENAVAAITLAIILASNERTVHAAHA